MGERAEDLARRLEATTGAVIAAPATGRDDDDRVLVHHLATCHALVLSLAQAVVNEEPPPSISWEMIHEINTQHVRANSTVGLAEARKSLQSVTASTAEAIRQLTDEQLAKSAAWGREANGGAITAGAMIERHLIRHAEEHLTEVLGSGS